jgi:hypothetical protein
MRLPGPRHWDGRQLLCSPCIPIGSCRGCVRRHSGVTGARSFRPGVCAQRKAIAGRHGHRDPRQHEVPHQIESGHIVLGTSRKMRTTFASSRATADRELSPYDLTRSHHLPRDRGHRRPCRCSRCRPGRRGPVARFIKELARYERLEHLVDCDDARLRESVRRESGLRCAVAEVRRPVGFALCFQTY